MNDRQFTRAGTLLAFVVPFIVYALTAKRTIALWDSSEFVATSYKLLITHPPGAPFYTLLSRIFLIPFPPEWSAFGANLFAALCAAITIALLFRINLNLLNRLSFVRDIATEIRVISALCGALTFAFCHSYWLSATEAEVYSLASLFIASMILLALIITDENETDQFRHKCIILLFYLLGLSVAVHVMNLAVVFILSMLFVQYRMGFGIKSLAYGFAAGLVAFLILNNLLFQGYLDLLAGFEVFAVNSLGLPFHLPAAIASILVLLCVLFFAWRSGIKGRFNAQLFALCLFFYLFGWSSYAYVIIRSPVNSPVSNNASDIVRLASYVKSEQFGFGEKPLLWGSVYNALLDKEDPFIDGEIALVADQETGTYAVAHDGRYKKTNYAREFYLPFPRMYDKQPVNAEGYQKWVKVEGNAVRYTDPFAQKTVFKPTMRENLLYFIRYQLGWLNVRYFLWNFVGRQNDFRSDGLAKYGNWISGIELLDKSRTAPLDFQKPELLENEARNAFYFLPLLLGLMGLYFLFKQEKGLFIATLTGFLAFSVGTTIFINQLPVHIFARDRDYIFLSAYLIFGIWASLGIPGIIQLIQTYFKDKTIPLVLSALLFIAVPIQMLAKNFNDHDRSADRFIYEVAKAYLDACPQDAILITNGDNATFPLWFIQEVEGYRRDVRIINFDLLSLDWNYNRLRHAYYDQKGLKGSLSAQTMHMGTDPLMPRIEGEIKTNYPELKKLVQFVDNPKKRKLWNGRKINYFPKAQFSLAADSTKLKALGYSTEVLGGTRFTNKLKWRYEQDFYSLGELALFDLIAQNDWNRPICFSVLGTRHHHLGLTPYMMYKGMVEQLVPFETKPERSYPLMIDHKSAAEVLIEKAQFPGFRERDGFIKSDNIEIARDDQIRNFYLLGLAQLEAGDSAGTVKTVEKALEWFPDSRVEYGRFTFALAKLMYRTNQFDEAREVMRTTFGNIEHEIRQLNSGNPLHALKARSASATNLSYLKEMIEDLKRFDIELANEKQATWNDLKAQWEAWAIRYAQ